MAVAAGLTFGVLPDAAFADTAPTPPEPATVSNDPLPTVQVDGVVWSQVVIGNTVYVGGNFTTARPAGAAPGTNTTPRSYILAYDITTGELVNSFAPTVNGQVQSLAASPDGSRLYAVGDFTNVNGSNKYRAVALNPSNGSVIASFSPGFNARVKAVVATNDTVYFGGSFTNVSGVTRTRLAAIKASNGAVLDWAPTASGGGNQVTALALTPDKSKLVVGGNYTTFNGATVYGLGAVDPSTGSTVQWDASNLIKNAGTKAAITSLSASDNAVYGTGYVFGSEAGIPMGNLEGTFSAEPTTGAIRWVESCHGDTYSTYAMNGAAYSVGHAHHCTNINGFPQTDPWTFHRATAFTENATQVNKAETVGGYYNFGGVPAPSPLTWYPELDAGTFTGQSQAAWSISGNSDYLVLGGEFPKVNNIGQQGLVRFARKDLAPNKSGPKLSGANYKPTLTSPASGLIRGTIAANYDMDNENLTYQVYRQGTANPIYTTTVKSNFFTRPTITFKDASVTGGQTYRYLVKVTDPFGNSVVSDWTDVTVSTTNVSAYGMRVLDDSAGFFWRLGEPSGTVANDLAGSNNGTITGTVTRGADGAIVGDSDKATTFAGDSNASNVRTGSAVAGPTQFAAEAWIKTTTTKGGKIIGFGSSATGNSSSYDRHVYMQNNGKLTFGVYPGTVKTVSSSKSYNDGKYHHIVANLGGAGMELYVDGELVGSDASVTGAQSYNGYWRVGGDNLNGWTNVPTSTYFAGTIDEVAVYGAPLTADQVAAHWSLSGWGPPPANQLPTAAFTQSANRLAASFDGSTSSDPEGSALTYAWDFGDGATATGVTANHNYAAPGTFAVTLTVTDNAGGTKSVTHDITVTDPNALPTAAFTQSANRLAASFDGSTSSDPDGTIANYAWDFGDGALGTGATANHTYAAPGTFTVKLTVTDNRGGTNTVSHDITVTDPNALPTAAFSSSSSDLKASLDGSASSDSDGSIVAYAWEFGDGATGADVTTAHTYAAGGTYQVKLTVTDNRGATASITKPVTVTAPNSAIALDDFERTASSSWGTSVKGGNWTLSGTAANFSVGGGVGKMTVPAAQTRTAALTGVSKTSTDTTVNVALDRPVGASSYVAVIGRRVDASNDYRLKLRFFENGDVNATLVRVVAGVETTVGGGRVTGLTYNSQDVLRVRLQVTGTGPTSLKAKVWKAGTAEPAAWTAQASDSTAALQVAGGIGVQVYVAPTVTNAPQIVRFDELSVFPVAG